MRSTSVVFGLTTVALTTSLVIGGAGDGFITLTACIQIISMALISALVCLPGDRANGTFVLSGKLLALASVLLPAVHLIPLPAATWVGLPGRAPALALLATIGAPPVSRALSLDPAATLATALELLPAIALFWATTRLDPSRQRALLGVVLAAALVSALLGAFQRAAGLGPTFADAHAAFGPGLFVNRNHQATLMLLAIVLTPVVIGRTRLAAILVAILLFASGIVATTSRAGLALLPLAIAVAALLTIRRRLRIRDLAIGLVALLLLAGVALASGAVQLVASRFDDGSERLAFWQASWPAIRDFAPWGAGIGTFAQVFPFYEPDILIGPYRIPAAHNDYVQLLVEGGIPTLALIVAGLGVIAAATIRLLRAQPDGYRTGLAAAAAITLILLHSIVDFPLRMMALSSTFGLLAAILLSAADRCRRHDA